jgi:hypothetical protein
LPFHTSRKIILSWRLFNETFHIVSYISFGSIVSSSDLSSLTTLGSLVFLCFLLLVIFGICEMESKSPQAERLSEDIQNNVPILLIIILQSVCLYDKFE